MPPLLDCHLAVVEGLVRFCDPETLAGGGIASGRYNQAGKINGERPDEKAVIKSILSCYDKNLFIVLVTMDVNGLISLYYIIL